MSQAKKWPVFPPHHRPGWLPPPSAAVDIPGRACARIFILRELRRLYNLPVVRRYEVAYARIAITTRLALGHRLGDCLAGLAVGDKKKEKKREGRSGTLRSNCVTEIDAPSRHCFDHQPNGIGLNGRMMMDVTSWMITERREHVTHLTSQH